MERDNVSGEYSITQKKGQNEALPELDISLLYSLLCLPGHWRHVQLPLGELKRGRRKLHLHRAHAKFVMLAG